MPLYEYRCSACARVFEAYRRLTDDTKHEACPACGGVSLKLGISVLGAAGTGDSPKAGTSACGGGSRRSPFG